MGRTVCGRGIKDVEVWLGEVERCKDELVHAVLDECVLHSESFHFFGGISKEIDGLFLGHG